MPFTRNKQSFTPEELYDPDKVIAVQIGGNVIRVYPGTYQEETFQTDKGPLELFKFTDSDSPVTLREEVVGKTESIQAMWQKLN